MGLIDSCKKWSVFWDTIKRNWNFALILDWMSSDLYFPFLFFYPKTVWRDFHQPLDIPPWIYLFHPHRSFSETMAVVSFYLKQGSGFSSLRCCSLTVPQSVRVLLSTCHHFTALSFRVAKANIWREQMKQNITNLRI